MTYIQYMDVRMRIRTYLHMNIYVHTYTLRFCSDTWSSRLFAEREAERVWKVLGLGGWGTAPGVVLSRGGLEGKNRGEKCAETRGRSRCLGRGNPAGWPATLISVGSFAPPKRSNRGEAAFNHSIADGSFLLATQEAQSISRIRRDLVAHPGCLLIILAIGRRGKQTAD